MSKFQSPGKAAAALGVHPATIRRWVDEGHLPGAVHTAGGNVRIPQEDIERLRGNSGCGKALLYLRVSDESERKYVGAVGPRAGYAGQGRHGRCGARSRRQVARCGQSIVAGADGVIRGAVADGMSSGFQRKERGCRSVY